MGALSRKRVRNITRLAVCFLASLVYVCPSMAKVGVSINSAGSCCPPSSLASRPENQGTRALKEEVIVVGSGVDGRGEEPCVGDLLWLLLQ